MKTGPKILLDRELQAGKIRSILLGKTKTNVCHMFEYVKYLS